MGKGPRGRLCVMDAGGRCFSRQMLWKLDKVFGCLCLDHGLDQRTGREVLACAGLGILRVLLQEAFVCVPFYISAHHRPVFLIDQINNKPTQLRRVLELVLGFVEDQAEQPFFQ